MGEAIWAVLVRPVAPGAGPLPGVVGMPGTGSSAEEVIDSRMYRPLQGHGPLLGWGRELAKRGYAVLTFSPKGTAVRRKTRDDWEEETKLLAPYARPQLGILADETIRASLVLAATDGIDPERIGLTGMSLGGLASWLAMSMAPWVHTAAVVCGVLGTMEQMVHHGQVERHSSAIFIPHMLRYFDHPEVVAAFIAPRPFMMVAPTEDDDMPREGVERADQRRGAGIRGLRTPGALPGPPTSGDTHLQAGILRLGRRVVRRAPEGERGLTGRVADPISEHLPMRGHS